MISSPSLLFADEPTGALNKANSQNVMNLLTGLNALGQESDSAGQLILYEPERERYRFFTDDLSGYQPAPENIQFGEVYVSPSLASMFGLGVGDEVAFPIARSGRDMVLKVAGFFEDRSEERRVGKECYS